MYLGHEVVGKVVKVGKKVKNLKINDTVIVEVYFANQTDDDYYIGSSTPHDWFYPVLYDPYVDVFSTPMLADTSIFDFRFDSVKHM